jgi:thioesterase domain-containing protein
MARQLKVLHHEIGLIGLIDTAPLKQSASRFKRNRGSHLDKVGRGEWLNFIGILEIPVDRRIRSRWHPFWRQSEEAQREEILARAKAHNAVPAGLSGDEFKAMLAVFQANLRALHTYDVPLFDGSVVLFRATGASDRTTSRASSAALRFWSAHAAAGCELVHVPGHHMSIVKPPAVAIIAERIRRAFLASARQINQNTLASESSKQRELEMDPA